MSHRDEASLRVRIIYCEKDANVKVCRKYRRTLGEATHVRQDVLRNEFFADFLYQLHSRNLVLRSLLIGLWILKVEIGLVSDRASIR